MNAPRLRIPHTLVLMYALIAVALVMTWLLPAGSYETRPNEAGRAMVVPGTFTYAEEQVMLPAWTVFTVVPRALADAQAVVFFVLLIGGVMALLKRTGAIEAAVGRVLARFGGRPGLLIFGVMLIFTVLSATFGMAAEYLALVAILVAFCAALRLDAMTAVGIIVVGYGVGYGVALTNPFTVMIAQQIADVPLGSGMGVRIALLGAAFLVGFHHVYRYALRVQREPAHSLVAGIRAASAEPPGAPPAMDTRHRLVLLAALIALVALVGGIIWAGWSLVELGALFLALGVAAVVIGRIPLDEAADTFIAGAAQLIATALLVGFARGIALILEDGHVLHTIVHWLAMPLALVPSELSAVGMLLIQSILNLAIPSGSGQAFATMPIMAPIGDLVGVSRQVAVLAFQLGDGFSNMIVPTNAVLMGILGLAGVPYDRWLRFIVPLLAKLLLVAAVALVGAVWLGYS
jgi:uncharacterized ion transporter superfamily protein YfcC